VSRAFVKEDAAADEPLPERRVSEHPNHVTPAGRDQLEEAVSCLRREQSELQSADGAAAGGGRLQHVERDLRYFETRLRTATVVDPAGQPRDEVAFGAQVTVRDQGDERHVYAIVGEDEADPDAGKVSWVSPLATVLMGARVGQTVEWRRPMGRLTLTVEKIAY
jgi:transcription elongation factor GreB